MEVTIKMRVKKQRTSLILVFSLQLIFLGSVGLEKMGLDLHIIREISGFFCLVFIPGFLLLIILKVTNLDKIEKFLYSLGLSLAFNIFVGVLINYLYPFLGISKPISENPLILTFCSITLLLSILSYYSSSYSTSNEYFSIMVNTKDIIHLLLLFLLPLLSILGVVLLDNYNDNILLLTLFVIISIMPILVVLNIFSKSLYPFIIWTSALSLVLYVALPTRYMRATDNLFEYFVIKLILKNGTWNPDLIIHNINSMPGIVLLPAIFINMLKINIILFYKIIAPLLASFIPLVLYKTFRKKWNEDIAFFSSFFYLTLFPFWGWGSITMKMIPSALFFVLIMLTIVKSSNTNLSYNIKTYLLIIFTVSLIVSHYGTSYLFVTSLIIATCILRLLKQYSNNNRRSLVISIRFTIFSVTVILSWYVFTTKMVTLSSLTYIIFNTINSIFKGLILSSNGYGAKLLFEHVPLPLEALKYLYMVSGFFISIGLFYEIHRNLAYKTLDEYDAISIPFIVFLIAPYIAPVNQYEVRIWYLSSLLLAPFLPIGIVRIVNYLKKIISLKIKTHNKNIVIAIFLFIFFLFNTGVIQEVVFKENYGPINYIGKSRILNNGNIAENARFYELCIQEEDVISASWLSIKRSSKVQYIYTDAYPWGIYFYFPGPPLQKEKTNFTSQYPEIQLLKINMLTSERAYIYLRYFNLIKKTIIGESRRTANNIYGEMYNITVLYPLLLGLSDKIYTNEGSEIYYHPKYV